MSEISKNSTYYIGICDDECSTCTYIEDYLIDIFKKMGFKLETLVWYSGETLCEYLDKGNQLDFLFLDIELQQMNGVQVGSYIRDKISDVYTQIVYISSKESYAIRLFGSMPLDFLVKPIDKEQISRVIRRGLNLLDKRPLLFSCEGSGQIYRIPYQDIIYFYSDGKKLNIVCKDDEITVLKRLKDIIQGLPDYFMSIHRSFVINIKYVKIYRYDMVQMQNGVELCISKVNRKNVRSEILNDREKEIR